jgi:hypothetical protein
VSTYPPAGFDPAAGASGAEAGYFPASAANAPAASPASTRLAAGSIRVVNRPIAAVRAALLPVVRQLEYTISTEQFSLIEAMRGSGFAGLSMTASRVPVALRIDLEPQGTATAIAVRLEDRWKLPLSRNLGAVSVYSEVFSMALAAVDGALGRIDPAAPSSFQPWWQDLGGGDLGALQGVGGLAARAEKALAKRTGRLLDGPADGRKSAVESSGQSVFNLTNAGRALQLGADDVDGILTAGQLVSSRPGKLPENLVTDVQQFTINLEEQLEAAKHRGGYGAASELVVSDEHVPVVTFLYQQAKLREQLPMRVLMVCTTCRLEKIVNPDFTRLRERNRRAKVLSGSVGAVFGSHNISPYILLGRLVQLKNTDPEFVCQRCQGLDADETLVTFCPQCGDRRGETVLRQCQRCDFDFRELAKVKPHWHDIVVAPSHAVGAWAGGAVESGYPAAYPAALPAAWPAEPALEASVPADTYDAGAAYSAAERGVAVTAEAPIAGAGDNPAAWHPDPYGRYELRYWNGAQWTEHVSTGGSTGVDPQPGL